MNTNELGKFMYEYCEKYNIPTDFISNILEDQKVVPMIRGKATEFNAFIEVKKLLNEKEWSVQKLNLNAQTSEHDEDISVTHMRTGIIVKVECKNATRGSFRTGKRCKKAKVPHCTIKCHRSRSNIGLAQTSNDRYQVDSFDIIISNLSNAIIAGATYTENFELINDPELIGILATHYGVEQNLEQLFDSTYSDWRFVKSTDIAQDGYLPRTPTLLLKDDPNWKALSAIESTLNDIVRAKLKGSGRHTNSRR